MLHTRWNAEQLVIARTATDLPLVVQNAAHNHRPYLHPLLAPDGRGVLTEDAPAHHPWQHGLYTGLNAVNGGGFAGVGFWTEGLRASPSDGSFHPQPLAAPQVALTSGLAPDRAILFCYMLAPELPTAYPPRLPRGMRLLLLTLLALAFALRLYALDRQNIWWDEARNIDVALRPLGQIATAPELDIQPPFYYWLLHGWALVSGAMPGVEPTRLAFLTRFFSVAVAMLSTALLYPLGARIFTPLAGLIATAIAACSPFWLAESQETRMYTLGFALLTAAAMALLWALRDGGSQTGQIGRLAIFTLFSALAVLTHYNALFILAAWYGWWGIWALAQPDLWRRFGTLLLCGLATLLLLTPLIPLALRQIPSYANPNLTIPSVADYLSQNWRAYLGGYAFDPTMLGGYGNIWLWSTLGVVVTGLILAAHRHWRARLPDIRPAPDVIGDWPFVTFLLVWAIGGLALYYVAVLDRGAFNVRYSSLITPALYLLLGGAAAAWGGWWRPLAGLAALLILVGQIPTVRADLVDGRFAREDIAGVTQWLQTVAGPQDLILVDQKYPFGFYYGRYALDPAQKPTGPEAAPARYLFVDINTVDRQLNEWAGQAKQIFWVQWFESDTDPRHAVHFLLDKAGRRAGSQSFQGYSIDWWTLDPPTQFELAPGFTPAVYRFPPVAETVAVSLPSTPLAAGAGVPVVIRWRRTNGAATMLADRTFKARVALYDENETRLAQSDERLLNDRHLRPDEWNTADEPLNVYYLPLPAAIAVGEYTLRLLVYDADTQEPLTLVDEAGNPAGLEATLGTVQIEH